MMSESQKYLMECPKCEGHGYRGPDGCGHCGSTGRMSVVAASALWLMETRKDDAYAERNRCVALVARMAVAMGLPVALTKTAIEGWSEDWHGCIYIGLPTGQVSWHFHDSQAHLFDGLPQCAETWDGHDTPEKYRRVDAAFRA
jgi:hypothetical protein